MTKKVEAAANADVAAQATGSLMGRPFQWDGLMSSRNVNAPDIYSGTGVPSASTIPGQARLGSLYLRVDGGGAGTTHIYVCTVAGAPGTWLGIA